MTANINFSKMNGLVPAVIQDDSDNAVLMVGFMNEEAYRKTLEDKQVVFWSRSKQRLWKKGETSGSFLDLVSVEIDCDGDALLVRAKPRGPVCHTGERTCFDNDPATDRQGVLEQLIATIRKRKNEMPEKSYTTDLFKRGLPYIGQKVGEEAVELAIASQYEDKQRCVEETADLVYHSLVLLEAKSIDVSLVLEELRTRMLKPKESARSAESTGTGS